MSVDPVWFTMSSPACMSDADVGRKFNIEIQIFLGDFKSKAQETHATNQHNHSMTTRTYYCYNYNNYYYSLLIINNHHINNHHYNYNSCHPRHHHGASECWIFKTFTCHFSNTNAKWIIITKLRVKRSMRKSRNTKITWTFICSKSLILLSEHLHMNR